jgi:hypothetical protein
VLAQHLRHRAAARGALHRWRSLGRGLDIVLAENPHLTQAILNGLDVARVAELVGHRSILTTQTYLHLSGKKPHLQSAAQKAVRQRSQLAASDSAEVIYRDAAGAA